MRRAHGDRRPECGTQESAKGQRRTLGRAATREPRHAERERTALLRKRGEHLERSFCHMLDDGGWRRAALHGCEKLTKRQMVGAMSYNLSL